MRELKNNKYHNRYKLLIAFICYYLMASGLIRITLYFLSVKHIDFSLLHIIKIFSMGIGFDLGAALFFSFAYSIYLLVLPGFLNGTKFDKVLTYFIISITLLLSVFTFLAEIPFWEEFNTRFNFIAVDYLVYTYEVFENINQSYPLPILIIGILLIAFSVLFIFYKRNIFKLTFSTKVRFLKRGFIFVSTSSIVCLYIFFIKNSFAEWSNNQYENELSKNGAYSFFAAYRSNELDFHTFYKSIEDKKAFSVIKKELKQSNQTYAGTSFWDIKRNVKSDSTEIKPNIILICIESFSAEFMQRFGNRQNITGNLDKLAKESIFFTNLYATGTRTVRGMEALTLSVPPSPGNSIVRRPDNKNLFSIATILKEKGYYPYFIYGGDGYFDNMNTFFGGQGFSIIDRNRGNPLSDDIKTERINIEDNEVQFENAWGISDEDLYNKTLKNADNNFKLHKLFFNFIMTTSNHKPYSFPNNKIDLKQGSREAAVKYTDFAIAEFIKNAKKKPWFNNTIFIIVADHCAGSAGKWELNIDKHHIPAFIYNTGKNPIEIDKLVSQIDLIPTVFGYLNWNYSTALYGKDINKIQSDEERALLGNYTTLGLLQNNIFTVLNDKKRVNFYSWNNILKKMKPLKTGPDSLREKAIAYYQTVSYRFKNGKMKNK